MSLVGNSFISAVYFENASVKIPVNNSKRLYTYRPIGTTSDLFLTVVTTTEELGGHGPQIFPSSPVLPCQ